MGSLPLFFLGHEKCHAMQGVNLLGEGLDDITIGAQSIADQA
jgi:hypothetical protein